MILENVSALAIGNHVRTRVFPHVFVIVISRPMPISIPESASSFNLKVIGRRDGPTRF
jgi:hypothetical protein